MGEPELPGVLPNEYVNISRVSGWNAIGPDIVYNPPFLDDSPGYPVNVYIGR